MLYYQLWQEEEKNAEVTFKHLFKKLLLPDFYLQPDVFTPVKMKNKIRDGSFKTQQLSFDPDTQMEAAFLNN